MAITFPLTPPSTPGYNARELQPQTIVGLTQSPFDGSQKVYAWPGQWLQFEFGLPPMKDAPAGPWEAFFMALNGPEGTFYLGDSVRKTPRGTITGSWTVGSGAVANSTTLPLTAGGGAGGYFALGDWFHVGSNAQLLRVVQVNMSGSNMVSVEVFPRLRSAYASGTAITYTNPKGKFRLLGLPPGRFDSRKICDGLSFTAIEAL
jgi:hypothetical protein